MLGPTNNRLINDSFDYESVNQSLTDGYHDALLADRISFVIVLRALPCTEFVLSLNILQKMQESPLNLSNNNHTCYAMLYQLTKSGYLAKNAAESFEGSRKLLRANRKNLFVYKVVNDTECETQTQIRRAWVNDTGTDNHSHSSTDYSESPGKFLGERRIQTVSLSERLFPAKRITRKISEMADSVTDIVSLESPAGSTAAAASFVWKVYSEKGGLLSVEPSADLLPLQLPPLEIGRQLVKGVFRPSPLTITWNSGLYRVAFALLLENCDHLSHPGWLHAVALWRARPAESVFPQKYLVEGKNVVDLNHSRLPSEAHSVATAKVCVFCAITDILIREEKAAISTKSKPKTSTDCFSSGFNSRTKMFDLTCTSYNAPPETCQDSDSGPVSKISANRLNQNLKTCLQVVTGKGDYRMRRTVIDFVNALKNNLKLDETKVDAVRGGVVHLTLHRKTE